LAFFNFVQIMPVKFGDLNKVAADVFTDVYPKSADAFEFKAKQKVASVDATFTTTVGFVPPGKEAKPDAPKISVKLPKPFGLKGVSIDKLEFSKGGSWALETALDKDLLSVPGLKVVVSSDLKTVDSLKKDLTFTGISDTQLKLGIKPMKQTFEFEATRDQGPATLGVKFTEKNFQTPDVGLRVVHSGVFASLLATGGFKQFEAHAHYKISDALTVAVTGKQDKDSAISGGAGLVFALDGKTTMKAKVNDKGEVDTVTKYSPSKGLSFILAGKYSSNALKYGLSVNIE